QVTLRALLVCLGQQDEKLVAAYSRDDVPGSRVGLQHLRRGADHRVAGGVTLAVVDLLQLIEVRADHRDGAVVSVLSRAMQLEELVPCGAIRQPGEWIGMSLSGKAIAIGRQLLAGSSLDKQRLRGLGQGSPDALAEVGE